MAGKIGRFLIGNPLETSQLEQQRLSNYMALAVFSSDAISSVAYATEEILLILIAAGTIALHLSIPITIGIAVLFAMVTMSYRQTIHAYPSGGGSYIVAKDNLGTNVGLVAAAALLTDYVLTVAVSVASGIAAITSAFPQFYPFRVELCLLAVTFITIANLRGVRESGKLFSIPTYFFIVAMSITIIFGIYKVFFLHETAAEYSSQISRATHDIGLFLVLRAFASGCTALTGIEAISNGIPAFRSPESRNAQKTLTAMAILCIFMFTGIGMLAFKFKIIPHETETVVSQIARFVFGKNILYYCVQVGTALILILAANTSFAGFPRLASMLARAGFMPRQMASYGDRLVFANGIVFLGFVSSVLLIIFGGSTHRLIPLYAVGVFLSFTLSQIGMIFHWLRLREPGWHYSIVVNSLGAVTTGLVTGIILITKFKHGAWIVVIFIPTMVFFFNRIAAHYKETANSLKVADGYVDLTPLKTRVFFPISGITTVALRALQFCFAISKDVTGIYINVNQESTEAVKAQVEKMKLPIPFVILDSPYRSIIAPLVKFIDKESLDNPDTIITLVIPEFMPHKWWHYILHNQTAMVIYAALRGRENVVITSVRKQLPK